MLVKDLMTPASRVISVKPEDSVTHIAELLHDHHITGVPVIAPDATVLGVISERDFITADSELYLPTYIKLLSEMDYVQGGRKTLPYAVRQVVGATAGDIMNRQVPFVRPDTTLEQLAHVFAEKRVNPIPVTDSTNHLLGIISRSDLIKLFSADQVQRSYVPEERKRRPIDDQVQYISKDFQTRFAYVAKARANIWITAAIVLFLTGFIIGIVYVVNPTIFSHKESAQPNNIYVP
jgi:CBS domain-containing protein